MITKKWHDFAIRFHNPIHGLKERLDVEGAEKVVKRELVERIGDKFETMEITELGDVTIWTTTKVWCIRKAGGAEKLIFLPRNPP